MGQFWVTDSAAQRAYTLEGGDILTRKDVFKLLGCTISLRKGARVPAGLAGICRTTQTDLERYRYAPTTAKMVIESKVMSRWYVVASVYPPTLWDHEQGNALVRRLYKGWCGISRYARVEALFIPQEDSGMGLTDACMHWVVGVQREWIRNLYHACRLWTTLAPPRRSTSGMFTNVGEAAQQLSF